MAARRKAVRISADAKRAMRVGQKEKYAQAVPRLPRIKNPEKLLEYLQSLAPDADFLDKEITVHTGAGARHWSGTRNATLKAHAYKLKSRPTKKQLREYAQDLYNRLAVGHKMFRFYKDVVDAVNAGETQKAVARRYGITQGLVSYWVKGGMPDAVSPARLLGKRRRPFDGEQAQRRNPQAFAYLLGTLFTSKPVKLSSRKAIRFENNYSSAAVRDRVAQAIENMTGRPPRTQDKRGQFFVRYSDTAFFQYFNRLTHFGAGTNIARRFLTTPQTRRAFLQAAFDQKGALTYVDGRYPVVRLMDTSKNRAVFALLSQLLAGEGIAHTASEPRSGRLFIYVRKKAFPRFQNRVGFRNETYKKRLEKAVRGMREKEGADGPVA